MAAARRSSPRPWPRPGRREPMTTTIPASSRTIGTSAWSPIPHPSGPLAGGRRGDRRPRAAGTPTGRPRRPRPSGDLLDPATHPATRGSTQHHLIDPATGVPGQAPWLAGRRRRGAPAGRPDAARRGRAGVRVVVVTAVPSTRDPWYVSHASSLVLPAALSVGVAVPKGARPPRPPRFAALRLHRDVALLAGLLRALHVATAIVGPYARISWLASVVPLGLPLPAGVDRPRGRLVGPRGRRDGDEPPAVTPAPWDPEDRSPARPPSPGSSALAHSLGSGIDLEAGFVSGTIWGCLALVGLAVVRPIACRPPARPAPPAGRRSPVAVARGRTGLRAPRAWITPGRGAGRRRPGSSPPPRHRPAAASPPGGSPVRPWLPARSGAVPCTSWRASATCREDQWTERSRARDGDPTLGAAPTSKRLIFPSGRSQASCRQAKTASGVSKVCPGALPPTARCGRPWRLVVPRRATPGPLGEAGRGEACAPPRSVRTSPWRSPGAPSPP